MARAALAARRRGRRAASGASGGTGGAKSRGREAGGRRAVGDAKGATKGTAKSQGRGWTGTGGARSGAPRSDARVRGAARPASGSSGAGIGGEQVEGRQAVRELLRARRRAVLLLSISDGVGQAATVDDIVALAESSGVPVRYVTRPTLDAMAQTDAPQGVIARAEPLPEVDLDRLVSGAGGRPPFLVVLDGLTDPRNLGAVMRSALSAGATGLVVGRHRSARLSPAAVKAAAGAVEYLPVAPVAGIPAALSQIVEAGVWTVGLEAGSSVSLWELEIASEPIALVLGAEGKGISRLALQRCDLAVDIPLFGPLDSLNVAAAAALACFEVARRRG